MILLDCSAWSGLDERGRAACLEELAAWAFLHDAIPGLYHFFDFPGWQSSCWPPSAGASP